MQNLLLKTHSATLHMSFAGSLAQHKAYFVLLHNARHELSDPSVLIHKIHLGELNRRMGNISSRNDAFLKSTLRGLLDKKCEFDVLGKDRKTTWGIYSLISAVTIRDGELTYEIPSLLRKQISEMRIWGKLDLGIANTLSRKTSLALYSICSDMKNICTTGSIPLEKLRLLFGLGENKYRDNKRAFMRRCIREPVREINEKTDLFISPSLVKYGRTIVAVRFNIGKNQNFRPVQPSPALTDTLPVSPPTATVPVAASLPATIGTAHRPQPQAAPGTGAVPGPPSAPSGHGAAPPPPPIGSDLPLRDANLLRRLVRFGLAEEQAHQFFSRYGSDRIKRNLALTEAATGRKEITCPAAYLHQAILKDFALPQAEALAERKRRHAAALAEFEKEMAARKNGQLTKYPASTGFAKKI